MADAKKKQTKSPGRWIGAGVFEFQGETYGYGDRLPEGLSDRIIKRLKEEKTVGKPLEPVINDPLEAENMKLKEQNKALSEEVESLKAELETLKKDAAKK